MRSKRYPLEEWGPNSLLSQAEVSLWINISKRQLQREHNRFPPAIIVAGNRGEKSARYRYVMGDWLAWLESHGEHKTARERSLAIQAPRGAMESQVREAA